MSLSDNHSIKGESMTGLLGQIPQLLAIASFISIASSTIYELGYFSVIGFVFFPVLSPSDFVFSFLFWMPLIALTGAAAIVFSLSPALKTTSKSSSKGVPKFFIGLYEWTSVRCSGQLRVWLSHWFITATPFGCYVGACHRNDTVSILFR